MWVTEWFMGTAPSWFQGSSLWSWPCTGGSARTGSRSRRASRKHTRALRSDPRRSVRGPRLGARESSRTYRNHRAASVCRPSPTPLTFAMGQRFVASPQFAAMRSMRWQSVKFRPARRTLSSAKLNHIFPVDGAGLVHHLQGLAVPTGRMLASMRRGKNHLPEQLQKRDIAGSPGRTGSAARMRCVQTASTG